MTVDYDLRIKTHRDGLYNELDCLELTTLENGKKSSMLHVDLSKLMNNANSPHDAISLECWNKNFTTKPNKNVEDVLSFKYRKSPGYLTSFIQALNDLMPFLDPRTSVADFIRIVTSENLYEIHEKIYLACKTNLFKYIILHLEPFFTSFYFTTIGKSGIFISCKGHPITTTNLTSADVENLKERHVIDKIFNKNH